jgi:hypothetical protein
LRADAGRRAPGSIPIFSTSSEAQFIAAPVVKAGRARAYVRRHLLSGFEKATVLEVGGDADRAEAVVADAGLMPAASEAGSVRSLGSPAAPITQQLGDRRAERAQFGVFMDWVYLVLSRPAYSSGAFVNGAAAGNLPSASSGQSRGIDDRQASGQQHRSTQAGASARCGSS